MKKAFFLTIFLLGLPGCWPEKNSVERLSGKLYILDVNTKEVYDDCHIPGALHVSFDVIEDFVENLDKNTDLVVYCSNYLCTTSGMVVKKLQKMGFSHAKAYEAGIAAWHQEGLPTEGICSMSFLNMEIEPPVEHDPAIEVISTKELSQLIEKYKKEGGIAKW